MNIQEYISSGIVESYVLGLTSREEQLEFEQYCADHPELREAKEAFERSLEKHAFDNAVAPPAGLKQKIWDDLNMPQKAAASPSSQPVTVTQPLAPVRSMRFAKLLAAASVILLIGSTILNFYYYNQYKTSVAKLDEMIASNTQLASSNGIMQARLAQDENTIAMMANPDKTIIVAMAGQPISPESKTTVYWDKQTKDVYLLVNNLPQPAAGKQYQLWALVDGKPVDAGVLDLNTANSLAKMKNIPRAQAFAITLEKSGGSPTPNLNALYVMGKI